MGNKILTICEHGNSRSVCLAWLLKQKYSKDAIACGICHTLPETFAMLCSWAELIIVTDKRITHPELERNKEKVRIFDVGPDRFFMGYPGELIGMYEKYILTDGL